MSENTPASVDSEPYSRAQAWQLLTEWTQSESLRKHALAVEACVAACGEAEAVRARTAIHKRAAAIDTLSNKRKLARPY